MAKQQGTFSTNHRLFNDLDLYREFCVEYGYNFDPTAMNNMKNYSFQQFSKYAAGKNFKDQWAEDARKLGCNI
jgi:hypothetical protein